MCVLRVHYCVSVIVFTLPTSDFLHFRNCKRRCMRRCGDCSVIPPPLSVTLRKGTGRKAIIMKVFFHFDTQRSHTHTHTHTHTAAHSNTHSIPLRNLQESCERVRGGTSHRSLGTLEILCGLYLPEIARSTLSPSLFSFSMCNS